MENAEGTVKIRMRGLEKGEPITFKYPTLKTSITFDGKGVAEVPLFIAKKLLGPDHAGSGYELVPEEILKKNEGVVVVATPPEKLEKKERKPKAVEVDKASDVKEFLNKIDAPQAEGEKII